MIQYLRALSASLLMSCSMWDFSDCRFGDIGEYVWYGRPRRVDERIEIKAFLIRRMQSDFWHTPKESFGCGDGNSQQEARNEAWREAHSAFERKFGTSVISYDRSLLEETLKLSDEKKYVACAEVKRRYSELQNNGQ